jgi:hypothetical protein
MRDLVLNNPQIRLLLSKAKEWICVWGRGTGKTTMIAVLMHLIVKYMPRSTTLIVGATYKQIEEFTFPSVIKALEMLGYHRNIHYVAGIAPPNHWDLPIEPPLRGYHNYILWPNGAAFQIISQSKNTTPPRGKSVDAIITDEDLMLDHERFGEEIGKTNRGNEDTKLANCYLHHGLFRFTSMPIGTEASHILDEGSHYLAEGFDYRHICDTLADVQLEIVDQVLRGEDTTEAFKEMIEIGKKRNFHTVNGKYYSEANSLDNLEVLKFDYIIRERQRTVDVKGFQREILNKYVRRIDAGFYASLDRKVHTRTFEDNKEIDFNSFRSSDCTNDADVISSLPLEVGLDWGSRINFAAIGQDVKGLKEFQFIKNLFVKEPFIIDDLADKFADYYEPHSTKVSYVWYDKHGNVNQANSRLTYAQQFADRLSKRGWDVRLKTTGSANISHSKRYMLWSRLFTEKDTRKYPKIRFNRDRCRELLISMETAPTKENRGFLQKDKKSESTNMDQEFATHGSDAADAVIWGKYGDLIRSDSGRAFR